LVTKVHLKQYNETHCKVECEQSVLNELGEEFTFMADNYKWDKRFNNNKWDGKIRLLDQRTRLLYKGLAQRVKKYCDQCGYHLTFDKEFYHSNVSEHEIRQFIHSLNLPEWLEIRDYQVNSILKCIRSNRRTLLSPTSSGKSLIIYVIMRWYNMKTIIIVPSLGLIKQMASDFISYGYTDPIHLSTDGLNKSLVKEKVTLTTWQSLENGKSTIPDEWYTQFDVAIGDEAHGAKAPTLISIFSKMNKVKYRFGTTGTLDDIEINKATIEGIFGAPFQSTTTRELIDNGYATEFKVKCIVLRYPDSVISDFHKMKYDAKKSAMVGKTYPEEIDFLTMYKKRTKFIVNLALSLKGNKLIFFKNRDQGKEIYDELKLKTNHPVFYIDGTIPVKIREEIRTAIEEYENAIIVASLGTTSTGISINKMHHMIAASPSKSKIKVLQSIGRMLRLHETKKVAYLYDIVDDLSKGTSRNFTLTHFIKRCIIYSKEKFPFKIYKLSI